MEAQIRIYMTLSGMKIFSEKSGPIRLKKFFFTSKKVETWFNRLFPESDDLEKITLISPSAQSVRSIPRRADYQAWLKANPKEKIYQFILATYREKFETDI